ncbi:phosphoadenosine phosphosulfate reductase family protein [Pseudomonas aeruginosa]|uniref:phosphoadenosine phosphosulfate reductase domain-containing protein n=1 Tax=Pseudomonas aeruginosa TaxID=287 RepID=UPI00287E37E1|nr:phosphoadenosine phosphosulfate reductase family protein [Pseudomonas aeruginosa]MDS9918446.1 phosphoadenosine phosphosulfate reductase family protein [Pseudomonas aeruginosa]
MVKYALRTSDGLDSEQLDATQPTVSQTWAGMVTMGMQQIPLLEMPTQGFPVTPELALRGRPNTVALTPEVTELLDRNAVVAVGVSGGKDSDACAIAVDRYLNDIGHTGPRCLIHADLGMVEWGSSLAGCQRLADRLGWELLVVKRAAGGLMERWEARWARCVERYENLECVKLILPWSTPAMRFCTSELKSDVITSQLKKRYPSQDIINVTGVRRQESTTRARMAVSSTTAKLSRKKTKGITWNAIIEWPVEDVVYAIVNAGLELHEAYTRYGNSRVSCCYCVLSSLADLQASASCPDNQVIYVRMVELEVKSGYGFQGNRWLADVAPHLLTEELRSRVVLSKQMAAARARVEAELHKHLLFAKGWPTTMPTREEAELIASVRRRVSDIQQLNAKFITGPEVLERYAHLIAEGKRRKAT